MKTTILALDLGKFKSVACLYDTKSGEVLFRDTAEFTLSQMRNVF